ncbi:DNA primase [Streptococcus sp. SGI.013]|uniref:DNA primase n=1 Tax=unclassified Streptococcus TaxID=2608887 RepID=UPI003D07AD6B
MGFLCGGDSVALTKETIAEIKNSVNIVDVIGEVVALSKAGRQFLGLCPFHKEKTPSFNVLEDRQFFHCFGCGKSGDVFKFLEEYRGLSFLESVQVIAERSGFDITPQVQVPVKKEHPYQNLFQINQDAAKFFHAVLMTTTEGEAARQYLYSRGLTDEQLIYFNIGLAPDASDYLYQSLSKKWDENTLLNSGLFTLTDTNNIFDSFRNRLMFPLSNDSGQVIGFSGRIWTERDQQEKKAKYKNTRATPIFNKSYELYHLDKAKSSISKHREVYLMEGFMDVIAAHQSGINHAVASMGTALTPEHIVHLQKVTKKVVLVYDGDRAGQEATAKALDLLKDFSVEIVRLPNQMDPDEFLQKNSKEALADLLKESRVSDVEFWIHHLLPHNLDNLQTEIAYVEKMAKIIAKVPSITAQNTYISLLADLLPDFNFYQIEQSVNNERLSTRQDQAIIRQAEAKISIDLPITKQMTSLERAENHLFHRLMHHPDLLNDFRLKEEFRFQSVALEQLYDILKLEGEIGTMDLAKLDDKVQSAYYQVLEENLPKEVTEEEVSDILRQIERYVTKEELLKQNKALRENSHHRDLDYETLALEQLIAQKRKME